MVSNILYSKVKFVRNLKDIAYNTRLDNKGKQNVLKLCLDACNDCGFKGEEISKLNQSVIDNLIDENLLETDFVKEINFKGYASNDKASVQINGLNHIEILAVDSELYTAYQNAKQVDKALCNKLHFAYSDRLGFLNPQIDKIGSGMSVSVVVMLPALSKLNSINNLPKSCEKLMFKIEPINTKSGLYLITSGACLGYSEKDVCDLVKTYIDNVLKCEIEMCKNLAIDSDEILDKLMRAKAIINSAVKITTQELLCLLSDILIAINCGIEKGINANQIIQLFKLAISQKSIDEKYLAKLIKNILK